MSALGGVASLKDAHHGIQSAIAIPQSSQTGAAVAAVTGNVIELRPQGIQEHESLLLLLEVRAASAIGVDFNLNSALVVEHADADSTGAAPGTFSAAPAVYLPGPAASPANTDARYFVGAGVGVPVERCLRYGIKTSGLKRYVRISLAAPVVVGAGAGTDLLRMVGIACLAGQAQRVQDAASTIKPVYEL